MYKAAFWNERYAVENFVFGTEPNAFLASVAERIPPGPVLCLAEGEGRNAVFLARCGHDVLAVDQSETGLAKARLLASKHGVTVRTQIAELEAYSIEPSAWAGIVWIFGHFEPELRSRLLNESARGLKPGGVIVFECYSPAQLKNSTGGPKNDALLVTADILRQGLSGLSLEILRETEREIIEGTGHTGLGAVVQAVAVRDKV